MINLALIERLVFDAIEGHDDMFLVDVKIDAANKIVVYVDSFDGITIDQCVEISRYIENSLDRDEEDFELIVSSPGLDLPLRVKQQYEKNIGRDLKMTLNDGEVIQGKLLQVAEDAIVLNSARKVRIEGKRKKRTIIEDVAISFEQIKQAKIIVTFK